MASRKLDKKYEHRPLTSSPLNPQSQLSSPSERINTATTILGPLAAPRSSSSSRASPKPTKGHHTCGSISPTERLLRHKAALAWRSASLRRHLLPGPVTPEQQGDQSSSSSTTEHHPNAPTTASPRRVSISDPNHHHQQQQEQQDFHVVILRIPGEISEPHSELDAKATTAATPGNTNGDTAPSSPSSWTTGGNFHLGYILFPLQQYKKGHSQEKGGETEKTRRRSSSLTMSAAAVEGIIFRDRRRGQGYLPTTRATAGTTGGIRRVSGVVVVFVVMVLCGVYLLHDLFGVCHGGGSSGTVGLG